MVIVSSFQTHPLIAFAAATTLIVGAGYTLWLVKRVIWGEIGNAHVAEMEDINFREGLVLGVFAVGVLVLGIWPKPLTDLMEPSIAQLVSLLAASKL
jgi:NADH-quinone oxidoreductase subunit M